jgi:hypothetical protein
MTLKREHCSIKHCNKLLEPYEIFYINNDKRDPTKSNPYCEFDFNHQWALWEKIKYKYRLT